MEIGGFEFYAKNQTAFSFVLSEMTMVFIVNYTQNEELIRSIFETEEMSDNQGQAFDFEKEDDDVSSLIYHLIEKTLGKSLDAIIDLDTKCFRYSLQELEEVNQPLEQISDKIQVQEPNQTDNKIEAKKPWWQFW